MNLLITLFIQPFFNVLIASYWLLGKTPLGADMGVAVIILTLFIRVLLFPITLASDRSEAERRRIHEEYEQIQEEFKTNPVAREKFTKQLLRANPRVIAAEGFMFLIQVAISIILWWIFAVGLEGEGAHLIYSFVPKISLNQEFDFLGYSLNEPHWQFNLIQTILIFLVETVGLMSSPYKVSKSDVVRYQLILPLVSFAIFSVLPAGKKLFIITTLSFSLIVMLLRLFTRWFKRTFNPDPEKPKARFGKIFTAPEGSHE